MKMAKWLFFIPAIAIFSVASEAVVNIQNVGAGARSASLGNSFVAVADNPDAVFANPAGVSRIEQRELAYTNVSLLFNGIDGDNLGQHLVSYVQPLGDKLGLGLGYERIGSDLMSENGAFLSLSYQLSSSLNVGLNGKYLFWSVGSIPDDPVAGADPLSDSSAGAVGLDLGVLWDSPIQGARVGLLVKNLNQPNVASGTVRNADQSVDAEAGDLPMDLHLGLAYQVSPTALLSVQWVARDLNGDEVDNKVVVGGETQLGPGLMVRAGGSRIFEDDATGDLNAGLGYRWGELGFDYGYHIPLDLTETNGAHRFSFGYQF